MVSDQEIAKAVETLLTQSQSEPKPLPFTSLGDVVHHLGNRLGFDLSHKALFIRDQINLFLFRSQPPPPPPPPSSVTTHKHHFPLQHPQFRLTSSSPQSYVPPQFAIQQQQQHRQLFPQLPVREVKAEGGLVAVRDAGGRPLKKGVSTGTKRRGGPGGLNKLCGITPELQVIVGESALSRTDIVKQLWAYIKKNNLQDPGNKRKIICDDALRVVFETDCTDMFKMNKLLAKHIIHLEPTKESSRKRSKGNFEPAVAENTDSVPCQVLISDALAKCLGTEEQQMSESEALRLVWEYIKVNNLEDPQNSVMILCDEKLKELFGCETLSAMGIPELVTRHHLIKQ